MLTIDKSALIEAGICIPKHLPVDLVFCWQCNASVCLSYIGNIDGGFTFVNWRNEPEAQLPLWDDYPVYFPNYEIGFRQQTPAERRFCERYNAGESSIDLEDELKLIGLDWLQYFHYVGGVPPFIGGEPNETCPNCGADVIFLAVVGNDNGTELGFFDNDFVQMIFTLCEKCSCITATHQVD